ncbi:MAG: class I SAM-dependent methyltransferase [Elusimicrobia bacterium]|nr:class I SAM-dependent methyltransferase [Elusimicrobiota bacterium]
MITKALPEIQNLKFKIQNFICPQCHGQLQAKNNDILTCPGDFLEFPLQDDIWRFILPRQQDRINAFCGDYTKIRHQEGRAIGLADFYRNLPFKDTSGNYKDEWAVRRQSFVYCRDRVIPALIQKNQNQPLAILDAGCGNGWLSYQLTLLGHQLIASDLSCDPADGMGALNLYGADQKIIKIQAEFERWPLCNQSVDAIIFNASFHYTENPVKTLIEAGRVLKNEGRIIIMDTPIYHDLFSGQAMIEERRRSFIKQFGIASDHRKSIGFLTFGLFKKWERELNIEWKIIKPYYGIKWHSRPLIARLRGRREPAKFHLLVGTIKR